MARLLETDSLSNQNISAALEIGSYTATATRLVHVRVACDQAAGNGDYSVYATLQIGGAGSAYRVIPITTATAAAGVTALMFVSIGIPVDNNDVLKVYLTGLAGDNANPDTRVDFYEQDYLRPATAGRTLNVSAGGLADADVVNWKGAAAPAMTGDAYAEAVAVHAHAAGAETQATAAAAVAAKVDTALVLDGAVYQYTANALELAPSGGLTAQQTRDAMKLAPTPGAPAAGSIDDHLDDMPVDVWTNATRTLTSTAAATYAAISGSTLAITVAATYSATISGLTIPATWTKVWFTLKRDKSAADTASILQIVESNPGVGTDGLKYKNAAAATAAAEAALTVNQGAGTVKIDITDECTDDLASVGALEYDLKALDAAGATTVLCGGTAYIVYTPTKAIA